MSGKRLFGELIKFAGLRIVLDRRIKSLCLELLEPHTKARQLLRSKLLDGFLDIFGGCHTRNIAFARGT